jgi:translocation and assembly module TamB
MQRCWMLSPVSAGAICLLACGARLEFRGTGLVEGSPLRLTGQTELDAVRNWPTELRLTGERVELIQLADAQVFVSPDLVAEIALPEIRVRGSVRVPAAEITLDELPEQAVRPSPDTIVHGSEQIAAERAVAISADIVVSLGDAVHYAGSGLNADLSGGLRLQYRSDAVANATGALGIAGTYETYGQSLELERGELLFAGPLDNPTLDVRAVRHIGETTVGVELSGPVQAPQTQIVSTPAMSEADALSSLLYGRPLSGSGEGDTATLRSAAVSMGLRLALPVVQRIGDSLGFDEFAIESNVLDDGALMAGKYLSPKLYVRYSYGLFNRIGGLLVRFDINNRLSLETRSGGQKSMDLLYKVEKD